MFQCLHTRLSVPAIPSNDASTSHPHSFHMQKARMATQLEPCDSPGCSGQQAPCLQQLPKSTHLTAKCGWPGRLQRVILVLTYRFLNTSHLGAHLPNSHAPAHRSHCRRLSLSAGALHGPTQVRPCSFRPRIKLPGKQPS